MITSLTDHRIDIRFAEYVEQALSCDASKYNVVTNGMYNAANPEVLDMMEHEPTLYLIDDHTCYVPEDDTVLIASQFTKHPISDVPMEYFQVSKLALFDYRFDDLMPNNYNLEPIWMYWGQYKPERYSEYMNYIPKDTYVIGRRYPEELSRQWKMLPFTKDLEELNNMISLATHTPVFGDELHNGVNLPYRIYEALMNGVIPVISPELLGDQDIDIAWILKRIDGRLTRREYRSILRQKRQEVKEELICLLKKL